jgi:hypothetical protein
MEFIVIATLSVFAFGGWWLWDDYQKVPLKEFGIEAMQRVLSFEPANYRIEVWKRGWMSRNEWRSLNKKQIVEITAELKRRGIE